MVSSLVSFTVHSLFVRQARGIRLHRPAELNGEGQRALVAGFVPQDEEAGATLADVAADPVRLDAQRGAVCWPVLLLYPQHRQSDLVQAFDERDMCAHIDFYLDDVHTASVVECYNLMEFSPLNCLFLELLVTSKLEVIFS